jgi:hypothetical protein
MSLILQLELIPESSWGRSLAHLLPRPIWDEIRRDVYKEFDYTCCLCKATDCEVHAHELWEYNDKTHVQKLRGFQCLCADCHAVKHWGHTVQMVHEGKYPKDTIERLTLHFCRVNNCGPLDFELHKVEMGNLYQKRSKHVYKIDFGRFEPSKVVKIWENLNGGSIHG